MRLFLDRQSMGFEKNFDTKAHRFSGNLKLLPGEGLHFCRHFYQSALPSRRSFDPFGTSERIGCAIVHVRAESEFFGCRSELFGDQ